MNVMSSHNQASNQKFTAAEIAALRTDLLQTGMDNWQAAELLKQFLTGRGYGVSRERAQEAVARLESAHCAVDVMHQELDSLALVM